MPWNVVKGGGTCSANEWAVVGGRTGNRTAGCHPDKDSARKQQEALYANEAKTRPGWAADLVLPSPPIPLPW
jgi:hypothetical protein